MLAKEGAQVIIADLNESVGSKLAKELSGSFVKMDVTSENDWVEVIDSVVSEYDGIDALVNNYGRYHISILSSSDIVTFYYF